MSSAALMQLQHHLLRHFNQLLWNIRLVLENIKPRGP